MKIDEWLIYLEYTLCSLSILSCLIILIVYFYKKNLCSWAMELVAYLTFSVMMNSVAYLLLYIDNDNIEINMTLCNLQAFLMIWFEFSVFLWASIIGISIYKNVINHKLNRPEWRRRSLYLCIGYFLPFIVALTAYFYDTFGKAGKWCWINTYNPIQSVFVFSVVIYATYWLLILGNLVLTFIVSRQLSRLSVNDEEKIIIRKLVFKILRYPCIQLLCMLPPTLNHIIDRVTGSHNYVLYVVYILFVSSQGLFYSIAYGYNMPVLIAIGDLCNKVFCCKEPPEEEENYSEQNSLNKTYDDTFIHKSLTSENV
jgi:hypothetical protein